MLDGFEAIRATMLGGFPPVAGAIALLRDLGAIGTARFAALVPAPARRLARRLFAGGGSRAWLYGSAGARRRPGPAREARSRACT